MQSTKSKLFSTYAFHKGGMLGNFVSAAPSPLAKMDSMAECIPDNLHGLVHEAEIFQPRTLIKKVVKDLNLYLRVAEKPWASWWLCDASL